MDLSITIASYNTLNYTRQCLKSIYENTKVTTLEIIVVDNASQDGSQDMIRAEFPGVKLICNTENVGVAVATNQGIEASRGRHFITMNSDVVVHPGSLDKLVEFMDTHPDAGGATARLILPDGGEHPPVCGNVPSPKFELLDAISPLCPFVAAARDAARNGKPMDYTKTQAVSCVWWGTAFIVRKEVIDAIGGQDPIFFVYGEDTDWSMRIRKAGWKLYYVAEASIVHYGGQSTGRSHDKMAAQLVKSRCRLIRKHYGLPAGLTLRAAFTAVFGIRMLKWLMLYLVSAKRRQESRARIHRMWSAMRSALTY